MFSCRLAISPLAIPIVLAAALAVPPAEAQAPRPGQLPPGPQAQPAQRGQVPPGQPAPPQGQPAPPKPYRPVAVTLPPPNTDPSFEAFRKQIADIATKMDRAALARLVVPANFFWIGEKGDKADKRKPGIDNLAAAMDLDAKDGSGWMDLARAAAEPSLESVPQRRGIMCAPANPMFDEKAAEQLARNTGTSPGDWGFPEKAGVEVHAAAQAGAPVVERLGLHLVRVIPEEQPAGASASPFLKVVTPSGKVGFVAADSLSSLSFDQICYVKDASGWKIAGYVGNN